jgi:hypothetical protein
MAHFPAMAPGPIGLGDIEYPTGSAALVILLTPERPAAPAARPGKSDSPASTPTGGSLALGLAALGLAAAGDYLIRKLAVRNELRGH